ncbi:MAG: dockerin type I repeat-containing protein, partial [Oscillospiraceae bacterium]|nr:dockerin type I repeat-containing protein [Oscillospiraceae bacterium]
PTTEEDFPPTAGVPMLPDDLIEPTTEELPPLAGEPMPPDEWIESTTEEEIPPLAGDIAPADGDINGDGSFGVSDVVLLQKWLLEVPDTHLTNWWTADFNDDNVLNVFDLCLMKRALIYTFD